MSQGVTPEVFGPGVCGVRARAQRNATQSIFAGKGPSPDDHLELRLPELRPPPVLDEIRCNSLHDHENSHATNYPLAGSAVAECVAFIALIARRADSLHVGCVCNAMQRNARA